ncbi:MAG: TonB-dependent receptor [Hyphomonadaceae bacterium]
MFKKFGAVSWIAIAAACSCPAAWAQQTNGPNAEESAAESPADQRVRPDAAVVIIYGDRQAQDPGSNSVISSVTIEEVHADHPAEILNTVPGVNVQMNSGQENLVAIRSPVLSGGAGQGSFLFLENGLPIRAPGFGNVNSVFELHHETAAAIEVVRGPGSVRYGSNAEHGLINVIAPEPGQVGYNYMASLSLNSLQRLRADTASAYKLGDVDMFAALSITDDNGWRDASGVDMQKLTWRAAGNMGAWRVVGGVTGVNLNQETAGYIQGPRAYEDKDFSTTNPNPEAYRDAWSSRANVRFERDFDGNTLTITPYAILQQMAFIQHFLPTQPVEKNGHGSLGLNTRYVFGPDNLRWTVGADLQWADGYLKEIQSVPYLGSPTTGYPEGVHYDYDVETLTSAVYGELDWAFATDWRMVGGLRLEHHNYDYTTNIPAGVDGRIRVPASRSDSFDLATPKLGVVYSGLPGGTEVYANYARGERAPQVSDQYRLQRFQTEDTLKVETLDSLEIGIRGDAGPVRYDVAAYTMKKDNFFFRDADGFNVPDGKTDHAGIEAQLSGEYDSGLFWRASASWSDQTYAFNRDVGNAAEDIVDGAQIDTAPEWLADGELGWRGERYSLSLAVEHVGEYFTNAANTVTYPGHTIANLRGSWRFSDDYEAFAIIRNITDERYADRADYGFGNERYFPGEPANITVGVRVRR